MLDLPLFNDGAKRFIGASPVCTVSTDAGSNSSGEWHKRNTLSYKPAPRYTVDLDQPPAEAPSRPRCRSLTQVCIVVEVATRGSRFRGGIA